MVKVRWHAAFVAFLVFALGALLPGCGGTGPANVAGQGTKELTVFAAVALMDVLPEHGRAFEASTGVRVKFCFGATGDLARQLKEGAPADLFFSSSREWTEKTESWDLLSGRSVLVATNGLACIVSANNPTKAKGPSDLQWPEFKRIAICDENVPAGKYAREALRHYNLLKLLGPRFVGQKDVRAALNSVGQGDLDIGFVYDTDAPADTRVRTLFVFDPRSHTMVEHLGAPVKASGELASARRFLDFVRSPKGQAIFKNRGFGPGDAP